MIKVQSFGIVPFFKEEGRWKVLLILHRKGNHWGFPKGKANPDETSLQTAVRELKEETGLSVAEILLKDPVVEEYQFRRKRQLIIKLVHYFPASVVGDLVIQQEEIRDAKWLTIPEALEQLTFKEARHILHVFCRELGIEDERG